MTHGIIYFRMMGALLVVLLLIPARNSLAAEAAIEERAVLASSYLKFLLAQQVTAQAEKLTDAAQVADKHQVSDASDARWQIAMESLRGELSAKFGDNSRSRFEKFIGEYEAAERSKDKGFLAMTSTSLGLRSVPLDYAGMRKSALETVLSRDMADASKWLGEVQTWIELRGKVKDTPPLNMWLSQDARIKRAKPEIKKPVQPDLASAEAAVEAFTPDKEPAESPMDSFSNLRKQKRDKALQEAQAGMQQVAVERQAAETEYAAKKLAAAQADADAMKSQAEKLAGVEKEALEQRQNSFGAKLKSIVGATVGGAVGAFTGGIGARAGQEAVNAIFDGGRK